MTIKVKGATQTVAVPASPAQIAEIQSDLGILTTTDVDIRIQANTQLGALASPVQVLIDSATVGKLNIGADLSLTTGNLPGTRVTVSTGPQPNMTLDAAIADIYNRFANLGTSPTIPVKVASPIMYFPPSATVTISNASPAVITWNSHGKSIGNTVSFSTTGGLPTGLVAGTVYYIIAAGFGANAFQVSLTAGGSAINTSSAGSGVHTGWSSADAGEQPTIIAGTYTSGTGIATITSRQYQYQINGALDTTLGVNGVWSLSGISGLLGQPLPATASTGARQIAVVEFATTSSGQQIVNTGVVYTVNAPAVPIPVNTQPPSFNPTSAVAGTILNFVDGIFTNTPTSFDRRVYNGNPTAGGTLLQSGTGTTFDTTNSAGLVLYPAQIASNAGGSSTLAVGSPVSISSGSSLPTNKAPVGFTYASSYPVGTAIPLDYGLLPGTNLSDYWNNNPSATGFSIQMRRGGANITGGGANVISYTPVPADDGNVVSYVVTPSNAAGTGNAVPSSGVVVSPQVGGGGGPTSDAVLVGFTNTSAFGATSLAPVLPSGAQPGDLAFLVCGANTNAGVFTAAGFTQAGTTNSIAAPSGELNAVFWKVLTNSEPASYSVGFSITPEILGCILVVFRNASSVIATGTPTLNTTANASPVSVTFPTTSYTAAHQLQVLVASCDNNTGGVQFGWTQPSGYTTVKSMDFDGSPDWIGLMVSVVNTASTGAGATGSKVGSFTCTAGGTGYIANSYIIG